MPSHVGQGTAVGVVVGSSRSAGSFSSYFPLSSSVETGRSSCQARDRRRHHRPAPAAALDPRSRSARLRRRLRLRHAVAITGAVLHRSRFSPLAPPALSLIANTAPVAYARSARRSRVLLRHRLTLPPRRMSGGSCRSFRCWCVLADLGVRRPARHGKRSGGYPGHRRIVRGPAILISNYINPWIVDIGASLISMGCLILFSRLARGNCGCRRAARPG